MQKRIIKFRAWDKEKKELYKPTHEAYKGKLLELMIGFSGDLLAHEINGVSHESTFPNRYELMQFTGLTDKNGAEIYDGDLIEKTEGGIKYTGQVIFGKKTLGFGVHVKYLYHTWTNANGEEKKIFKDKFYRLNSKDKVIGNIFEHKHLLEK